jgi:hypothetical protein
MSFNYHNCLVCILPNSKSENLYFYHFISENKLHELLFFAMLWDIDLIFGMWVYSDKLQIEFTFRSGPMIMARGLWNLAKYLVATTFFHSLWILRRLANVSPFFNSLNNRLRITKYCLRSVSSSLLKFTYQKKPWLRWTPAPVTVIVVLYSLSLEMSGLSLLYLAVMLITIVNFLFSM